MPIESGSAGVPIFRGIPGEGAQSLSSAYGEQPWLGDAFGSFTGSPNRLPVDTHEMVAMVAPRGLFIMDNPHIANLGPRSASVAALGGAEVYKALGAGEQHHLLVRRHRRQPLRQPAEWRTPLQQNIQKFLLKTGNAAGHHPDLEQGAGPAGRLGRLADPGPERRPDADADADAHPHADAHARRPRRLRRPPRPPARRVGGCTATVSVNQWTGGFVATRPGHRGLVADQPAGTSA